MSDTPENNGQVLDKKRKNALMMYLSILFGAAFLLVVLTYFIQMRDTNETIAFLSQSNTSALNNAEKLQDDYQAIVHTNAESLDKLEDANEIIAQLEAQLEATSQELLDTKETASEASAHLQETIMVYEDLLNCQRYVMAGNYTAAQDLIESISISYEFLDNAGKAAYDGLKFAIENPEITEE